MKLIFEWDEKKAKANLRRRKISFDEAKTIFNDPLMLTFPDEAHSSDEVRFTVWALQISIVSYLLFTRSMKQLKMES